jgi:hypothetical protein
MGAEERIEILKSLIKDNEAILEHSREILHELDERLRDLQEHKQEVLDGLQVLPVPLECAGRFYK